ncbi:MAG: hypothetical protein ACREAA_18385 [Candidatus Polarisedimenticolia bacterium]
MMKAWIFLVCVLAAVGAGLEARGKEQAEKGFDRLKALAGDWEAKGPDGAPLKVTFTVTSNGTAVMEHLSYNDMVTMYHRDGDQLMLTHYCGGNNQPRMKAPGLAADGKTMAFAFHDVTNLASKDAAFMKSVTITFVSPDKITEQWTHAGGGTEQPMTVELTRVK